MSDEGGFHVTSWQMTCTNFSQENYRCYFKASKTNINLKAIMKLKFLPPLFHAVWSENVDLLTTVKFEICQTVTESSLVEKV